MDTISFKILTSLVVTKKLDVPKGYEMPKAYNS